MSMQPNSPQVEDPLIVFESPAQVTSGPARNDGLASGFGTVCTVFGRGT